MTIQLTVRAWSHEQGKQSAWTVCYPRFYFSLSFARQAWLLGNYHPGSRHHNTGIPANRAGSVVIKSSSWFSLRLTMAKVPVSLKASKPCSCYKTLSSIARFYALPLTSPILKAPEDTHKISAPPPLPSPQHLHTRFSILYELLALKMVSKISKKQSETKSLTKFKIRLNVQVCFWLLLIRLFTTTTSFQHTVTTPSLHNQISTSTPISLQHLKSLLPPKITIFCYFMLKSKRNKFYWLTNYSHYLTNSRPI